MFMARKTKAMTMPIMANTEITMKRVMLMREGEMTTVLRSTGGPSPPANALTVSDYTRAATGQCYTHHANRYGCFRR